MQRGYRTPGAAEYLGIAELTLEKWRVAGRGPKFRKIGKIVVYAREDLDQYLDAHARNSTSDPGSGLRP